MPISLAIIGANGKMGRQVLSLALSDPAFAVSCACVKKGSIGTLPEELKKERGIIVVDSLEKVFLEADVGIDFSSSSATREILQAALLHKKPLVIGTTGLDEATIKAMKEAANTIPILYSPNFSFGVAACLEAVKGLATLLKNQAVIEIEETHHISKKDSPSGTALALAKAMGEKNIEIRSKRLGKEIGEHRVIFSFPGEQIEIRHNALSREAFAKGALQAAKFLSQKSPGLYSIQDLFK